MGIEACTRKIKFFDHLAPDKALSERDRLMQEKAALIQEKLELEKRETAAIQEEEKRETAAIQEKEKRETALALEQLEKTKQETIKLQNGTLLLFSTR